MSEGVEIEGEGKREWEREGETEKERSIIKHTLQPSQLEADDIVLNGVPTM